MKKLTLPVPEKRALRILLLELPVVLLSAVALLIRFLTDWAVDPIGAGFYYMELIPYITVSLGICIGTAVVADLSEREKKAKKE